MEDTTANEFAMIESMRAVCTIVCPFLQVLNRIAPNRMSPMTKGQKPHLLWRHKTVPRMPTIMNVAASNKRALVVALFDSACRIIAAGNILSSKRRSAGAKWRFVHIPASTTPAIIPPVIERLFISTVSRLLIGKSRNAKSSAGRFDRAVFGLAHLTAVMRRHLLEPAVAVAVILGVDSHRRRREIVPPDDPAELKGALGKGPGHSVDCSGNPSVLANQLTGRRNGRKFQKLALPPGADTV